MNKDQFLQLLNNYLLETISEEETRQLFQLLERPEYQEIFKEEVGADLQGWRPSAPGDTRLSDRIKAMVASGPAVSKPVFYMTRTWLRYAAAVLLFAGIGAYLYFSNTTNRKQSITAAQTHATILPGTNKAYLTLADGSTIVVDDAASGDLARQGNVQVVKTNDDEIAYRGQNQAGKEVLWNTMRTPPGGQYRVMLPDGTKVWLNAASSITFPTAFTGNKREVKIKGEIYFEVVKNKQQPFIVDVDGRTTVEVLGTSFNINAYENEAGINTSLVEGSVKILNRASPPTPEPSTDYWKSAVLSPGQQAVVSYDAKITIRDNADMDQALAWKNGMFNFEGLDLKAVMRQLERWYDIKVQYKRPVNNDLYGGKIYRNLNLSEVLDILEKIGGVKFNVEEKTLIVQ